MADLIQYKQFEVLDPEPSGLGGQGINRNFKTSADHDPNFIENGLALADTTGWATYDDGAVAAPVDGTGGSPTITFARITSGQLIGDASFELTKPASDVQGEGISFDFTIDTPYQGRRFNISFAYDNTAAADVFGVYIFDIGGSLIATDVVNLETGTGIFVARFDALSNNTYRFIIHTQSTSAVASTLKLDAVRVSPAPIIRQTTQFFADQLDSPNSSDWVVNALAPVAADTNNTGLTNRLFDDTVEEGAGFIRRIPDEATNITLRFRSRAETGPGATAVVLLNLYERGIPDNAAVDAWSGATQLTALSIPTNEFFQYDSQTIALSTLGLTAGQIHQFELTRDATDGGDTLTGDWALLSIEVEFT